MKKQYLHFFSVAFSMSLMLMSGMAAAATDVVLVVSRNSPIQSLSRDTINDVFMGKITTLPQVGKVIPLDRSEDKLRADFYQAYTGKNLSQIKAHWAKIIFTGRGYPPKTMANIEELKSFLERNPNAIGYVSKDKVDDTLRVVKLE